jgi:hypothetical protein
VIKVALTDWIGNGWTCRFLIAAAAVCFWFPVDSYRPVRAEAESIVVDMSVYGQVEYGDFFSQAEAMANEEISRQFSQNPELSEVRVVIVGDRDGEIVPILTIAVSRTQWQETPRTSAWAEYYNSSYALLQRHERRTETVARVSGRGTRGAGIPVAQIDRALDEGRLSGEAAQEYLPELD